MYHADNLVLSDTFGNVKSCISSPISTILKKYVVFSYYISIHLIYILFITGVSIFMWQKNIEQFNECHDTGALMNITKNNKNRD
jgi:hypothetical protein